MVISLGFLMQHLLLFILMDVLHACDVINILTSKLWTLRNCMCFCKVLWLPRTIYHAKFHCLYSRVPEISVKWLIESRNLKSLISALFHCFPPLTELKRKSVNVYVNQLDAYTRLLGLPNDWIHNFNDGSKIYLCQDLCLYHKMNDSA